MSNNGPNYTKLDAPQTIKQAFVESIDAHRVVGVDGNGITIGPANPLVTTALPFKYDYGVMALSVGNTRETFTFKTGGSGGTTTGTVVINYTTSTRDVLVDFQITAV